MKNLQVKLKPQDLNFEDAAATLHNFQVARTRSLIRYPAIELCDDGGTWGAVCAIPSPRHLQGHPITAERPPTEIWLVTALPELSDAGNIVSFQRSPTLFHPVPAKRNSYCSEKQLQDAFAQMLACTAAEKHRRNEKRFKWKALQKWAHEKATREVNFMLKRIYDRGDRRTMKATYRYPFELRRPLYDAVCLHGEYAYQLLHTFPLLAAMLWNKHNRDNDLRDELERMVLAGAKLKEIARRAGIPWSLRNVPPQLTNRCRTKSIQAEIWQRFKPTRLNEARCITRVVEELVDANWNDTFGPAAGRRFGILVRAPELGTDDEELSERARAFMMWAVQHAEAHKKNLGYKDTDVARVFRDLNDWAMDTGWHHAWHPKVSLDKAVEYSDAWHTEAWERTREEEEGRRREEAPEVEDDDCAIDFDVEPEVTVSVKKERGPKYILPEPWLPQWDFAKGNGKDEKCWHVLPLDKAYKITEEGQRMKNCVGTYRKKVQIGKCYIYSLRVGDQRCKSVVTIDLRRLEDDEEYDYYISQARGKCNTSVPEEAEEVLKQWCKAHRIARSEPVTYIPRPAPTTAAFNVGTGATAPAGNVWSTATTDASTSTATATFTSGATTVWDGTSTTTININFG